MRKILLRLLPERSGTAALEFALTVPILMVTTLGVIEFGRVMWAQSALNFAVEQAARCRTLDSTNCGTNSATQTYATSASGYNFSAATFTVTTGAACGTGVTGNMVSASYPFQFLTTLISLSGFYGSSALGSSLTLSAQACFPTG